MSVDDRAERLPWPYNGIVRDLEVAVEHGCNYLAAVGLVCWSEFLGREIATARTKRLSNHACFRLFVTEYMGYDLGDRPDRVYDTFRNGLVHEFAIKGNRTAVASRLYTLSKSDWWPGLAYDPPSGQNVLFVEEYFRDFKAGLARWLAEREGRGS